MGGLKEIRNRISSVMTTRQVTSAMKMVSAAKLRKAQDSIIRFRPYAFKFREILSHLAFNCEEAEENLFVKPRELNRVLIVVVSSNRGLCGAFNANVVKLAMGMAYERYGNLYKKGKVDFMAIGKNGREFLVKKNFPVVSYHRDTIDKVTYDGSSLVINEIIDFYIHGKYDCVEIVFNQFKNAGVQVLTAEQLLPISFPTKKMDFRKHDFIIEPDRVEVINELIPRYIKAEFHRILLESQAAEHGARMTAMHKATDNATDMLRDLRLKYNKARQATITNEIIEIVGGSEALNK